MSAGKDFRILAINPGSTSTKLGLYEGERCVYAKDIQHSLEELARFNLVIDQLEYREEVVRQVLAEAAIAIESLDAIAARGGRLQPIPSGVYAVNDAMRHDAEIGFQGDHASNLACLIGWNLVKGHDVPVYVVDPVSVDEMWPIAKVSGIPTIPRTSLSHALNMKMVAKMAAQQLGKSYDQSRLIVAHLGGGGSVSAHLGGRMVDLYNSDKEGPMAIERSGGIPSIELMELCYTGLAKEQMLKKLAGQGGVYAHLGTKDLREVEKRVEGGDEKAELVLDAYCYQVAKYIGALAASLEGQVDAICISGGIAHSQVVLEKIIKRVRFIAEVLIFPGGEELDALALGVLSVLKGVESVLLYPSGDQV